MMKIFLDTEFTDLVGTIADPALISIGLITENGERSFYVELTDNYTEGICSYFVIENVLPLLDASTISLECMDFTKVYSKATISECRELLKTWLELISEPIQICCDAPNYDWAFLKNIFDGYSWPINLLPDVKLIHSQENQFKRTSESLYSLGKYRRHHALDDAKVMQMSFKNQFS